MIADNLFESVLIEPARQNADALYIVSGYATATMASQHADPDVVVLPADIAVLEIGRLSEPAPTSAAH